MGQQVLRHQDELREVVLLRATPGRSRAAACPSRESARSSSKPAAPPPESPKSPRISSATPSKIQETRGSRDAGQAAVVGALERALGGETDAGQLLGRPPVAAPESAVLRRRRLMKYSPGSAAQARMPPSARRTSSDARQRRVRGDAPVEAVAAEVHQPAAPRRVRRAARPSSRALWYSGWVGVRTTLYGREQLEALGVEVLVGDDVVAVAHLLEPVEEIECRPGRWRTPEPRGSDVGEEARAQVHDGPERARSRRSRSRRVWKLYVESP